MTTPPPTRHIPSLDGLRAVSILLVIVSHTFGPVPEHGFAFNLLLKHGGMGVRIFFIISGFLITALCIEERARFGSLSLKLFYLRRILRIVPAFYLYALAMLALGLIGRLPIGSHNWIYVFTWTMNYNPDRSWFVAHLWSLSVEEQFYLAWPLALKILRPAAWVALAGIAVFAGLFVRALHLIDADRLPYAFPFVAAPLAMGALLAIHEQAVSRIVTRWSPWIALSLIPVLLFETATEMQNGPFRPAAELIVDGALTALVAWCVFRPETAIGRSLNAPVPIFIGKLSYSLYLWQELWLWGVDRPLYWIPLGWTALFLSAAFSYLAVERPTIALRRKLRRAPPETQSTR